MRQECAIMCSAMEKNDEKAHRSRNLRLETTGASQASCADGCATGREDLVDGGFCQKELQTCAYHRFPRTPGLRVDFHGVKGPCRPSAKAVRRAWPENRHWADRSDREIDFVIQREDEAIPIEVKGGEDKKAPSFKSFVKAHAPLNAIRFSRRNLRRDGGFVNIPLYLTPRYEKCLRAAAELQGECVK